MANGFNWHDAADVVVFKTVQGVAIYRNGDGDVIIRQQAGALDDEDTVIIVPDTHAEALLLALQKEVEGG